jgi:3-oxoacyl-[acyl-carrier-protein] synthase-3
VNLLQMGDGAGAVILAPANAGSGPVLEHLFFGSLGPGRVPGIRLDVGGSSRPAGTDSVNEFRHDFGAVREGGLELFQAGIGALRQAGVDPRNVDWILTHQASAAIPQVLAPLLGVDPARFIVDCDAVGNLGSASIWVALHRLRASGRLRDGQSVMVLGAEASKYLFGGFIYRHIPHRLSDGHRTAHLT